MKSIVLILSEKKDVSTDLTVEWLRHYGISFIRLNEEDSYNVVDYVQITNGRTEVIFSAKGQTFYLSEIKGVWFRRGFFRFDSGFRQITEQPADLVKQVDRFLRNDAKTIYEFLIFLLQKKVWLSNPLSYNSNKLICLIHAIAAGLKVPDSVISRELKNVNQQLGEDHGRIITKAVQDCYDIGLNDTLQSTPTALLQNLDESLNTFHYSFFQTAIQKKYELRIYFLGISFYACAIFAKTIDGRQLHTDGKFVRIVPFTLPADIKKQLITFISKAGYNTGSIDIIVDVENKYHFLELNPVGQYDYVSQLGNYFIDKRVAEHFFYEGQTV